MLRPFTGFGQVFGAQDDVATSEVLRIKDIKACKRNCDDDAAVADHF
jgi:hypothetical protein